MAHRLHSFITFVASLASLALVGHAHAADVRLSGPVVHENLAVYFVHGASGGDDPLTLQEALGSGKAKVYETRSVNELTVENLGDRDLFIQAGDIVKGGQQDRVLSVSLLLPPHSGAVPIQSFCVEYGRWTARGKEDSHVFASAASAMPSREAKLALRSQAMAKTTPAGVGYAPAVVRPDEPAGPADTSTRQQEIWARVRGIQDKLSTNVGGPVAAAQSPSSLQLSMENEKVAQVRKAYVTALQPAGEAADDIVGYVFAINGKINSADIYPSHGLFKKMWPKLIEANATEAIGDNSKSGGKPPAVADVQAFLAKAEAGKFNEQPLTMNVVLATRDSDQAVLSETRRADGSWVHRNYLAK